MWRDASGRLTFDVEGIPSSDYPAVCRRICERFSLCPAEDLLVGPDEMFWTFGRDRFSIGLDWDVWYDFMVVAMTSESEGLAREIADWLRAETSV